jgi:hypothetical protein
MALFIQDTLVGSKLFEKEIVKRIKVAVSELMKPKAPKED